MLQKLDELTERAYYGVLSMAILIGSVMGGIMAMYVSEKSNMLLLSIGLAVTMANLVFNIAQMPAKWIVRALIASVLINTLIILLTAVS